MRTHTHTQPYICTGHVFYHIHILGSHIVTSNKNATQLNLPWSNHDLGLSQGLHPGDEFVELSGGCGVFCDSLELAAGPDKKKATSDCGKGLAQEWPNQLDRVGKKGGQL